jgi:hypothetical protein
MEKAETIAVAVSLFFFQKKARSTWRRRSLSHSSFFFGRWNGVTLGEGRLGQQGGVRWGPRRAQTVHRRRGTSSPPGAVFKAVAPRCTSTLEYNAGFQLGQLSSVLLSVGTDGQRRRFAVVRSVSLSLSLSDFAAMVPCTNITFYGRYWTKVIKPAGVAVHESTSICVPALDGAKYLTVWRADI